MIARTTRGPIGFTLIELLVVIAVIAVLIGVFLPSLAGARNAARGARCLAQMRTLGQFTALYADASKGAMPRSQHSAFASNAAPWGYAFFEYVTGGTYAGKNAAWTAVFNGPFRCPADARRDRWSYGYNVYFELTAAETRGRTWNRMQDITFPDATVVFGEISTTSADHAMAHFWTQQNAPPEIDATRHRTLTNAVFLDGHARGHPFESLFDRARVRDCFNPATAQAPYAARRLSMNKFAMIVLVCTAGFAHADIMPRMGGPMKHVMVHLHGTHLEGHVDAGIATPLLTNYGETYSGNASVLNGTFYNAQYGWMKDGIWAAPAGAKVWIEQLSATAGLLTYRGGTMSNMGSHTFAGIFGTDGSSTRIEWNGSMLHNWYAATALGEYSATYRIYFGDDNGAAISGYEADEVTVNWSVVPAPGAAAMIGFAGLAAARRRRF